MREIKFRAWHREKKCWLDSVRIYGDGSWSGSVVEERGEVDGYDERECELMQYTGLKDKNGKEIYEGDIVYIHDNYLDSHCPDHRGIIKTHPSYPHKLAVWGKIGQVLHGKGEQYLESSTAYLEVIGNIYENPEFIPHSPDI